MSRKKSVAKKKTVTKQKRTKTAGASEAERAEAIRILERAEDCGRKLTEALRWQSEGMAYLRKHGIHSAEAAILAVNLGIQMRRRLTED